MFPPVPSRSTLNRAATLARSGETAAPAMAGRRQNTSGGPQVPDPIAPPTASRPAEAVELVSLAVSDGDLEAALAQYETRAVLRPWARDPGGDTDGVADALIGYLSVEPGECKGYLVVSILTARVRSTPFRGFNQFIGHRCVALFLFRILLTTEGLVSAHSRTWKAVRTDRGWDCRQASSRGISLVGQPYGYFLQ